MAKKTTKKTKAPKKDAAAKPAPAVAAAPLLATPAAPISVAARAHEIWIAKGKPVPGAPLDDWLQAEREIAACKS